MKDYYKILGIERTATDKEIKSAYRNLAKKHHPDMTGKCEEDEQFKDIQEAYSTLIDPEKRRSYNKTLGKKVKVNVVRSPRSSGSWFKMSSFTSKPEPLVPHSSRRPADFDSLFEQELRYFEKLRQYLLRRFFDDDFFF